MEMVRRKACAVSLCNNDSKHSHVRFGMAQLLQEESPQNHKPDFGEAPAEIVSDDSDFWFYFLFESELQGQKVGRLRF